MIKSFGRFERLEVIESPFLSGYPAAVKYADRSVVWVSPAIYSRLQTDFDRTMASLKILVIPLDIPPRDAVYISTSLELR